MPLLIGPHHRSSSEHVTRHQWKDAFHPLGPTNEDEDGLSGNFQI